MPALQAIANLLAQGEVVCIAPQNLIEFWAVATRPMDVNGLGWTTQKTRMEVDRLSNYLLLLQEPPDILTHWLQLVTAHDVKGKRVHDTRFVAVMLAHGITHLLTFNIEDFKRYAGITLVHPNAVK